MLPDVIYAAPDIECNVYYGSSFDSDSPNAYTFEVQAKVGCCQNERLTWTPKAAPTRRHTLEAKRNWLDCAKRWSDSESPNHRSSCPSVRCPKVNAHSLPGKGERIFAFLPTTAGLYKG